MTKAAKAARAEMAAQVRAAREAMPEPYGSRAAYEEPVATLAYSLAFRAAVSGLRFGRSASAGDPRHVSALVLGDAYEGYWQEKYGSGK